MTGRVQIKPHDRSGLLVTTISENRYVYARETELHRGLEQALRAAGFDVQAEVQLSPRDRVDFLVDGIAIEVKVKGTADALTRQCQRYAEHDAVEAILVVTTRGQHRAIPRTLAGKPVDVVVIGGFR